MKLESSLVTIVLVCFLNGTKGQQQGFRVCKDSYRDCRMWYQAGMCHTSAFKQFINNGCPKTCGLCTDCRDMYREAPYCAEWKNKGFCDTFPGQMDSYCPKTCLLCGDSVAPPTMGQHPLPAPTGIPPINPGYRLKTDQPYEDTRIFKAKKPLTFLVNEKLQRQPIMKVMQSLRKKRLVGGNEIPLPSDVGFGQTLGRPASKPKPALQTLERADNSIFNKVKDHTGNIQDHFQKLDKNIAEEFSLANRDQYNEIEGYPIADDFDEQGSEDVETAAVREHDKDQKGPSDYNTYVDAERKFQGMNGGSDYYIDRYSKDPDLAASQQLEQQQLMAETGEKFAYGRSNFDLPLNQLHRKLNDAAKNANHLHHRKKANDIKVSHKRH